MSTPAPAWSTWRELVCVLTTPQQLRRTLTIAGTVGTVFFLMNQLSVIAAGQATPVTWLKAVLTYATPVLVSSLSVASATRRAHQTHN